MPATLRGKISSEKELTDVALDQVVGGATGAGQVSGDPIRREDTTPANRRGMMAEGPNERMPPDW